MAVISLLLLHRLTPLSFMAAIVVAFLCGAYSILDHNIPRNQKLAIVYLMFAGVGYFWVGILGLSENSQNIAQDISIITANYLAVPPFALFHLFVRCTVFFPCTQYDVALPIEAPYQFLQGFKILSAIEVGLGVIAIIAAYFLSKRCKWAYFIWTGLTTLAIAAALLNIVADDLSARAFSPAGHISPVAYISILWAASYIAAFWILRRETHPSL